MSQKISAIVPAYNEAERIGKVLAVLTSYPRFAEVIVVDDGSKDDTENIARHYPIRYIKNEQNLGKGKSMDKAVKAAVGDIIFFADADITGFTHTMIDEIVDPVLQKKVEMFVAMRHRALYDIPGIMHFIALLGGERALTKTLWVALPDYYKNRFEIETGLNFFAKKYGKGLGYKVFRGLGQTIKEEKYGFWSGLGQRISMTKNVIVAQVRVWWRYILRKERVTL